MIEVQQLAKTYRSPVKKPGLVGSVKGLFHKEWVEKHALHPIDFRVEPGEIVGLIGANGAGKTTLVKMLSGIMHPSSGQATVLGHTPWERRDAFRRQVALIMGQKAQLWWDLPAEDCFELLRDIYQIEQGEYRKRLDFFIEKLGLSGQMNIQIRRLSLGERMKMELVAALLHGPKVLYLDEPTIGLDISAQRTIREFLLEYRKTHKPAMILTSHYMEDIEFLCERVMILREGQKVYDGLLSNVTQKHAARKVITCTLANPVSESDIKEKSQRFGLSDHILEITPEKIKFQVSRSDVGARAAQLLSALDLADISIENEDISIVIESLMKGEQA